MTIALRSLTKQGQDSITAQRQAYKAEQAVRAEAIKSKVKVSSIFCYSWGYEQTNVDFYQVVEIVGKSTLKIREIGYKSVKACSCASDEVVLAKDAFIKPF